MKPRIIASLLLAGAALIGLNSSIFIVDQTSQAIVLQFGEYKNVYTTPGLKFKIPFIQEVIFYDKRILDYDLAPISITTVDQKRLMVDTYVRYRIHDALSFFKSIKPATEQGTRMRLEGIISSSVRNVMGKIELPKMLSLERSSIMKQIQDQVTKIAKPLGLEIVDVRIIKTELPVENRNAVFERMNSELIRFAKENRAKGDEIARGIRANADRDKTIILAEAQQIAQGHRGKGEAKAIEITNEAFSKDPEFYEFYKTLDVYRETLTSDTEMMLSTDSALFNYFNHANKR